LNIAHKVYAVCGDNAPNNDTFCDHFHSKLLATFNDDPNKEMDIPRCLFRGRASRIDCLAHICSLIAEAVFKHFIPGTREEAQKLVDDVANGPRGTGFAETCARLSVYMKIRTLVLWIMGSDERRKYWHQLPCDVFIPLDVTTRWNSLYLMMQIARKHKTQITLFGRSHPACQHPIPTDQEWEHCEQVERCMEPFYNHILAVSNEVPCLPEYAGIMWGLVDLVNDVIEGEGDYAGIGRDLKEAFLSAQEALDK
jgi:hypothetical protein